MKNRRIVSVFLLLLSFAGATGADAATAYYVAHNGSDRNTGRSLKSAWQTLARADAQTYAAGDVVNLEGGYTFPGTITNASGGSPGRPVTWRSYGSGRATVDGGDGSAVKINADVSDLTLRDLNFVGAGFPGNTADGVHLQGTCHGIVLRSLDVSGFGGNGVILTGHQHGAFLDDVVSHDNAGYAGISIYGVSGHGYDNSDITIAHCTAYNNVGQAAGSSYLGSGIQLTSVNGAWVERCCAHDNGLNVHGCGGPSGIWCYWCNRVTIQYNESYHNHTRYQKLACDCDGFDLDGGVTNSILQYNYSHDNDGAGLMCYSSTYGAADDTIRGNISQNDGRNWVGPSDQYGSGVFLGGWPAPTGIHIYNNTVFARSGQRPLVDFDTGSNCDFRNNIVASLASLPLVKGEHATCQGNDYWTYDGLLNLDGYSGLAAWRRATGQETLEGAPVGRAVDPQLTDPGGGGVIDDPDRLDNLSAYRLQSGSPLRNAGVDLSRLGTPPGRDGLYGAAAPGVWPVGADAAGGATLTSGLTGGGKKRRGSRAGE